MSRMPDELGSCCDSCPLLQGHKFPDCVYYRVCFRCHFGSRFPCAHGPVIIIIIILSGSFLFVLAATHVMCCSFFFCFCLLLCCGLLFVCAFSCDGGHWTSGLSVPSFRSFGAVSRGVFGPPPLVCCSRLSVFGFRRFRLFASFRSVALGCFRFRFRRVLGCVSASLFSRVFVVVSRCLGFGVSAFVVSSCFLGLVSSFCVCLFCVSALCALLSRFFGTCWA